MVLYRLRYLNVLYLIHFKSFNKRSLATPTLVSTWMGDHRGTLDVVDIVLVSSSHPFLWTMIVLMIKDRRNFSCMWCVITSAIPWRTVRCQHPLSLTQWQSYCSQRRRRQIGGIVVSPFLLELKTFVNCLASFIRSLWMDLCFESFGTKLKSVLRWIFKPSFVVDGLWTL